MSHCWHPSFLHGVVDYWWCCCGCGSVTRRWMGDGPEPAGRAETLRLAGKPLKEGER